MPLDPSGLGIECQDRAGVEIVARPHRGVERTRIADAPIHGAQFRIERTGDPGRAAAELPGVALPGVAAGFAGSGNRVGAPQVLAGLRIPAVDEVARAEFGAGDAGDHYAVGDERSNRHRISGLEVDRVLAPQLLAGLGVERDHIGVERGAEDLTVIDRCAAIDDAAADDTRRLRRIFDLGLPDLLAGLGVYRHRGAVAGDVEHALVDQRLRFLAPVVVEAVVPHRDQPPDVVLVDLVERAEAIEVVAHPIIEHVAGVGRTLRQFLGRLCHRGWRKEQRQSDSQ